MRLTLPSSSVSLLLPPRRLHCKPSWTEEVWGTWTSRFGFLSWKPPPHPGPLQPAPARVGAAVPRAASAGHPFKRDTDVWETREDANNCSPNADAGLMLLSAADSFPALKSTHHPTLTSHPPWGGRRVPFIRLIPSPPPTPPEETGYFLANLYVSNFHINKTKVMIRGFLRFALFLAIFPLFLSSFPFLHIFPRFR